MLRAKENGKMTTIDEIHLEHKIALQAAEKENLSLRVTARNNGGTYHALKAPGFPQHQPHKRRAFNSLMNVNAVSFADDDGHGNEDSSMDMSDLREAFAAGQAHARMSPQPTAPAKDELCQTDLTQQILNAFAAGQAHAKINATPAPPAGPPPATLGQTAHPGSAPSVGLFQSQLAGGPQSQGPAGTEACRDFSKGRCTRTNCRFSHDASASAQLRSEPCYTFMRKGMCIRGSSCRFSHDVTGTHAAITCKVCKRSDHLYGPLCTQYGGCKRCSDKQHLAKDCTNACKTCNSPPGISCPPACAQQSQLFRRGKRPRTQE
jgi:hypothetical protein